MIFRQLEKLYHQPLFDLISQSRAVHLQHWRGEEVQRCSLLSIKTGACSEDCAYCAQSAHYSTGVEREQVLSLEDVMAVAAAGACARRNAILHGRSLARRTRWLRKISGCT